MEELYLLYSPRGQGWFTKSSTYSSDIKQARELPRSMALDYVKRHRTDAGHMMIPVRLADMKE